MKNKEKGLSRLNIIDLNKNVIDIDLNDMENYLFQNSSAANINVKMSLEEMCEIMEEDFIKNEQLVHEKIRKGIKENNFRY